MFLISEKKYNEFDQFWPTLSRTQQIKILNDLWKEEDYPYYRESMILTVLSDQGEWKIVLNLLRQFPERPLHRFEKQYFSGVLKTCLDEEEYILSRELIKKDVRVVWYNTGDYPALTYACYRKDRKRMEDIYNHRSEMDMLATRTVNGHTALHDLV